MCGVIVFTCMYTLREHGNKIGIDGEKEKSILNRLECLQFETRVRLQGRKRERYW